MEIVRYSVVIICVPYCVLRIVVKSFVHAHSPTGIIIGLDEVDISVTEDSGTVEVCASVISGDLQRSVSFTLTSNDGTATGKILKANLVISYHVYL